MLSKKVLELSGQHSVIRDIFEFGMERAKEVGPENVFDFSIGNPSVPAPKEVDETAVKYIKEGDPVAVHGYTSNAGIFEVRDALAKSLNSRFGTDYRAENIFMTIGAAAAIGICFKSLVDGPEDEIITFAPYFPEYQVYAQGAGCKLKVIPAETDTFQIDFDRLSAAINENTKAVLINSPNNPSGAVYSEETIKKLAELLRKKQEETGHSIYIISDEPYREIVYDGVKLPHVPFYYDNTLVCYSFSKSLSIPGERIGYIIAPCEAEDFDHLLPVFIAAGRLLSYVSVPALYQKVVGDCADLTSDLSVYQANKDLFYHALTEMGYECVEPGGAFYLFPKALEPDANAFCERAKKYDLLMVPGDSFGCPGYVRISYCVPTERIEKALPLFQKLIDEYKER
ncbi:pyridoxal phosphate-dependent aminotransferase [Anaerostipes sp.]|uniref:pyridoxal phosphate-dependent aminotransferase n=1 Tax=Anaerostipes sp. TaxID=1872530 RepID=UPI0025B89F30|nr:pyridoxal phosphate-dependent aminotransferase [Anaerostipes sp.]MBS7007962.1 pyridoxal phosphate-dependent aminotransferase [Anaerostipes sp.]